MADPTQTSDARPSLLKRLTALLRGDGTAHSIRESLEEVIEESERESPALAAQERVMLANILRFGELRVDDVMVPRADIVGIEEQASLAELVALLREAQHSRLPVYRETLDDPIGFVHIKDVLSRVEVDGQGGLRWPDVSIASLGREILFVPPSMPARDLLLKMQTTHTHMALVIDEHGGTDGLVSIEDLVEEIVGQIADEHDTDDAPKLTPGPDGGYDADARLDLADFQERTGVDLSLDGAGEDVDTLGGLAVALAGHVPQRGEIVPHPSGFEFEIAEADPRRVRRLRLRPPPAPDKP
ncbi:MAG TPA: hemolysin family protein [Rhizomicrobium sp.]|jgi:CBS domain containing-hemolysin-like protein|nr:hemolysin family protein [Rhizomicrobium sp.]